MHSCTYKYVYNVCSCPHPVAGKPYIRCCINNIFNSFLFSVCNPGFYNSATSCLSRCGHCKDNATCDNESGQCTNGCELNFKEPYCQGTPKYFLVSN